jgi:hypothetical protein
MRLGPPGCLLVGSQTQNSGITRTAAVVQSSQPFVIEAFDPAGPAGSAAETRFQSGLTGGQFRLIQHGDNDFSPLYQAERRRPGFGNAAEFAFFFRRYGA